MPKPHIPFINFPIETLDMGKIYPLISQAMLEIGRYGGKLPIIPNPNVLLSPLARKEATLSSRIEGTIVSLTEVLEHDAGQKIDDERKQNDLYEIKNYREALMHGAESVKNRKISMSLIKELHAILTKDVRGGDKTPGQVRTIQNLVGKKGDTIETARFVPPSPEILSGALENFEKNLLQNQNIDVLLLLAIIHAQFEILHPFNDGNGRLGRMLIPLFLYEHNILNHPAFYMSEYLEKNDIQYRNKLLAITDNNDWQGWCEFFLGGVIEQAKENNTRAESIMKLYEMMKQGFAEITNSIHAQSALEAFFEKPVINTSDFITLSKIPTRKTAVAILQKLEKAQLIQLLQKGTGQKPSIYTMQSLLMAADGDLNHIFSKDN